MSYTKEIAGSSEKKNNSEKWCIFHVPNYIDPSAKSGSQIRPPKMLKAFKAIGYNVDAVFGYGSDRKKQIKKIEQEIANGRKYDFLYSESSTMPTLLTEKNHLPLYPILDFGFFAYCKKHNIRIGLFYRDVYWKFDIYKKKVSFLKRCVSVQMFKYDLKKYDKLVDILYLPSDKMRPYVRAVSRYKVLPPGCDIDDEMLQYKISQQKKESDPLHLFYVGGVGDMYDLTDLFKVVNKLDFVHLTVCCRIDDWNARAEYYRPYMGDNITIVHGSGDALLPYYRQADICMLFFESPGYREFAMPIKLFEYISKLTPVIATKGSAAGDFVEKNDIGWNISYKRTELEQLLRKIGSDRTLLEEKKENLKIAIVDNSWQARAEQVAHDLKDD